MFLGLQVARVNLPSLVLLGEGDPLDGVVRAVANAAVCGGGGPAPLVLYLPHFEAWALAGNVHSADDTSTSSGGAHAGGRASEAAADAALRTPQAAPQRRTSLTSGLGLGLGHTPRAGGSEDPFLSPGPRGGAAAGPACSVVTRADDQGRQALELVYGSPPDCSNVVPRQAHRLLPPPCGGARRASTGAHTSQPLQPSQQQGSLAVHTAAQGVPAGVGGRSSGGEDGDDGSTPLCSVTPLWVVLEQALSQVHSLTSCACICSVLLVVILVVVVVVVVVI